MNRRNFLGVIAAAATAPTLPRHIGNHWYLTEENERFKLYAHRPPLDVKIISSRTFVYDEAELRLP